MNFHIANWYVDVGANRIHNSEQDIKLEDKVMTLLVYLAKHQGDVVSRHQLEADVWADRVISYDALTSCITRLRKVLGDDSRNPLYIETVPKKGYRLIASVNWDTKNPPIEIATTKGQRPVGDNHKESINNGKSHKKYFLAIIFISLLIAIALITFIYIKPASKVNETTSAVRSTTSIVVLPFDNLSSQSNQDYFSDGITTDISIALSKLSGLHVIATPSKQAKNTEQLAHYSLTGSVQKADNQLRVNVILVDNHTRHQLWAESYDREITDVFEVQDNITSKIVTTLSIRLTEEEKQRVAQRYTNNINAYDQFLRGQASYIQHTNNENLLARQHFRLAIEIDPNFSRAYSTLALTHVDDYRYQWNAGSQDSLQTAVILAKKALAIDNRLPQAYWALAYGQTHLRQYQQAIVSLEEALKVHPNFADGYAYLALINIYADAPSQGLKMIRKAMQLNPNYPAQYLSVLGQAHYSLKEYEDAVPIFRNAINKNYGLLTAHIMLTATLSQLGLKDEAIWAADQLHAISPGFSTEDLVRIFPLKNPLQLQALTTNLQMAEIS